MSSSARTVAFIVDQAGAASSVNAKPMFGEYGLYCDSKMVAMVCDDRLFLKPTAAGHRLAPGAEQAPPYPGAKPCLIVDPDRWDDADWLAELFRATAAELPEPKARKRKTDAR